MSWVAGVIGGLQNRWVSTKERKQQIRDLEAVLAEALSDGHLDDEELDELSARIEALGLDPPTWRRTQARMYSLACQQFSADRRLTSEEEESLKKLASRFGIEEAATTRHAADLARYRLLVLLEEGILPELTLPGLILQRGETPHWREQAEILEEKVIRREYVGGSSGFSFRIAKGVRYHVGGTRGRLVSHTGIVPVSQGEFIVTSKRLIFRANTKNFATPLDKIIDLQLYTDGLRVGVQNKQKPVIVRFHQPGNTEIVGMVLSGVLNPDG